MAELETPKRLPRMGRGRRFASRAEEASLPSGPWVDACSPSRTPEYADNVALIELHATVHPTKPTGHPFGEKSPNQSICTAVHLPRVYRREEERPPQMRRAPSRVFGDSALHEVRPPGYHRDPQRR
ncbi:hypothetical protein RE9431_33160 [Prescottella equi]|nr:hypothetical protein RE9431_33160 [Prescottella equi]BCN74710.1 hypothetical protein RE0327_33090 [Prescottella equi]